ncbi:MAG: HD domain-containing protein [Planctomycetia bacterium]|nr:HD domain-containing protein [Planctomycetia bacterium]
MDLTTFQEESLSQDSIHGYIAFSSPRNRIPNELYTERDIIDSPWVQRLRQIHQLQTAWIVYPTAEHTRFQHVLGAMHLASVVWNHLKPSFFKVFEEKPELTGGIPLPSSEYIESTLRLAALLHDVGHGPFGHFFDEHFLRRHQLEDGTPLNHEILGGEIILHRLGEIIRGIRRNPGGTIRDNEVLSPEEIAFLIVRPRKDDTADRPFWLRLLRTLFSGLYTVDNMDFVLRDAYMSGFNERAFDLERLLHYSFFTEHGLTLHQKGLSTLTRFLNVRAELFRAVYFHHKVRAIDLLLADLFIKSKDLFYPQGNPLNSMDEYLLFTEWTLFTDVSRWGRSSDPEKEALAGDWTNFLHRKTPWQVFAEKTFLYRPSSRISSSIFSDPALFEAAIRGKLPPELAGIELRFDICKHTHRPDAHNPAGRQNFLYLPALDRVTALESEELYSAIPQSFRICRIFGTDRKYQKEVVAALEKLSGTGGSDDLTNM